MPRSERRPLTPARVFAAATAVADAEGLGAVTMRRVARELGVEAMSLYHHVANKDALLDGMVDAVFAEFELPRIGSPWRDEMQRRCRSARAVLRQHPWAISLLDSRVNPGLATLRHHDAVVGVLRSDGFPVTLAAHAAAVLDAYVYGFVTQEVALPFDDGDDVGAIAAKILADSPLADLPFLAEIAVEHMARPGYAFGDEFEPGLDLILDGLAGRRAGSASGPT